MYATVDKYGKSIIQSLKAVHLSYVLIQKSGQIKQMTFHYHIWILCIVFTTQGMFGQQVGSPSYLQSKAYDSLCIEVKTLRLDSITRLCLSFMHKHNLRKDPKLYEQFCQNMVTQSTDKAIANRIHLLNVINKMKQSQVDKETADEAFEKYYDLQMSNHDKSAALECLFEWARFFERRNEQTECLKILFYGEKFGIKYHLENDINYQAILNLIGYTLWELEKPTLSNEYFLRSIESKYTPDNEKMIAYNAIGINYQRMDSLLLSLEAFSQAEKISKILKNDLFRSIIHGNAAYTLYKLRKLPQAYQYAKEDKEANIANRLYENAVGSLNLLVKIELEQVHYAEAKVFLNEFDLVMPQIKAEDYYSIKRYKEAEYTYYEKIGDYRKALFSHKSFIKYEQLFTEKSNKDKISELKLDAAIKLYAKEMEQKEEDRKMRSVIEIGLITSLILLLFVPARYYLTKLNAIEKDKIKIEILNKYQSEEIDLLKIEIHNLLAKIKIENEQYEELYKSNSNKKYSPTQNDLSQPSNESLTDIEKLKSYNLARNDQWEEFKILFSKLHPNFEDSITSKMGNVSTAELRLMMLQSLGLTTKDMAHILFISVEGVKKSKYRLYKKIGINSSEELDGFLGLQG